MAHCTRFGENVYTAPRRITHRASAHQTVSYVRRGVFSSGWHHSLSGGSCVLSLMYLICSASGSLRMKADMVAGEKDAEIMSKPSCGRIFFSNAGAWAGGAKPWRRAHGGRSTRLSAGQHITATAHGAASRQNGAGYRELLFPVPVRRWRVVAKHNCAYPRLARLPGQRRAVSLARARDNITAAGGYVYTQLEYQYQRALNKHYVATTHERDDCVLRIRRTGGISGSNR